jgi:hypothetical protein
MVTLGVECHVDARSKSGCDGVLSSEQIPPFRFNGVNAETLDEGGRWEGTEGTEQCTALTLIICIIPVQRIGRRGANRE